MQIASKKLALICQHFHPEMLSTGIFMTQIATDLSSRGWPIRVYCGQPIYRDAAQDQGPVPEHEEYEGVEIIRVPTWGNPRGPLLPRGLNAFTYLLMTAWRLFRDRHELKGIINSTNPPFLGLAASLVNLVTALPFVTIVHDLYPDAAIRLGILNPGSLIARVWARITCRILNRSEGLVVIGRDMAELVHAKLTSTAQKITLIPNWADDSQIYPIPHAENSFRQLHNPKDHFTVQYSGRMGRTHNLEPLLQAAARLQDEPVLFQLIGDGAKRAKLEQMAAEMNLQNVQLLPYQPYDQLAQVLSAADLAVVCLEKSCTGVSVPSKSYGIMACARPIMAFMDPNSEIGLMIQETGCGVVLADPTVEAVFTQVRSLIANPAQCRRMGEQGYSAFLEKYTLTSAIQKYDLWLKEYF